MTPLKLIQAVEENRAVESLKSNGLIEKSALTNQDIGKLMIDHFKNGC